MTRLSAVLLRSRAPHRRHVTERALARAAAFAPPGRVRPRAHLPRRPPLDGRLSCCGPIASVERDTRALLGVGVLVEHRRRLGQQRRELGQLVQAAQAQPFQEQRRRRVQAAAAVGVGADLVHQPAGRAACA